MSDAKFKIGDVVYDFPEQIRLGDAVLVRELVGIDIEDLAEAGEVTKLTAYLAISVWQANPKWSRQKVARFVEQIDIETVKAEGGEPDPPVLAATILEQTSPASSNGSTTTPAASSEAPASATTPASSGAPTSPTSSG